jgi:hypothetical protein
MKKSIGILFTCLPLIFSGCFLFNQVPTIEVLEGNTTIASGSGPRAFGSIYADGMNGFISAEAVFTIRNTGTETLVVTAAVSGGDAADFRISTLPVSSIASCASTTLGVRFDPFSSGSKTASITITSNDPDKGSFTYGIAGDGVEGWILIDLAVGVSTREDVVAFFGREPEEYAWGGITYTVDTLPSIYIMEYSLTDNHINIVVASGVVIELRNEHSSVLRCCGALIIGLTPAEVFAIVGDPSSTIVNHNSSNPFDPDVFYQDINGTVGYHYYKNTAHGVRMFFSGGLTTAVYLLGTTDTMELLIE